MNGTSQAGAHCRDLWHPSLGAILEEKKCVLAGQLMIHHCGSHLNQKILGSTVVILRRVGRTLGMWLIPWWFLGWNERLHLKIVPCVEKGTTH